MLNQLKKQLQKEIFYPYPQEKVWYVLTNSEALAGWLMENDFQPRLGHKFKFIYRGLPGVDEIIECEVIEINKPYQLSYTWKDSIMCQPSIVTWTLKAVEEGTQVGTQLKLQHRSSITSYVGDYSGYSQPSENPFIHESRQVTSTLSSSSNLLSRTNNLSQESISIGQYRPSESLILNSFLNGKWEYQLVQKLPNILSDNYK